jgi:signal transduction histidine kinase
MSSTVARSKYSPTTTHIDDIYEKLKKEDPKWLAATLQERWSAISADGPTEAPAQNSSSLVRLKDNRHNSHGRDTETLPLWYYDVTASTPPPNVTKHVALFRDRDWASTELGPMSSWSTELRCMLNLCFLDPRPAALWWGKNKITLYNEGYVDIMGARHPRVLGQPFATAWPEVSKVFNAHFAEVAATGNAVSGANAPFLTTRNNFTEEIWASWAMIPVAGEKEDLSFYNPVFDTTGQYVTERRMSTLRNLGHLTSSAQDIQDFWKQVVRSLEPNHYDVPFAAIYAAATAESALNPFQRQHGEELDPSFHRGRTSHSTPSSAQSSALANRSWTLEGMLGLPINCAGLPSRIDNEASGEMISSCFRTALVSGQITVLSVENGTFPKALQGVAKSRAYGDNCTTAVLCPIGPTGRDNVLGFMILGINPRLPYDSEYDQFIQQLSRQMATSIASVVLIKEELRQSKLAAELAAQDRIRLSEQLAITKQQAEDSELRFRNMADMAPVALFHFDEMGNVLYANDDWFELTQHPRDEFHPGSWYNAIDPQDHPMMDREWETLTKGGSVSFEVRLVKPFITDEIVDGEQVEGTTWIIAAAYTDKREDGSVKAVLGSLTDISRQKWIENYHSRKTEAAMELKRQQENFMDMTSHEARNPLSAITLCAESIVTNFQDLLRQEQPVRLSKSELETHLENAEVIMSCAQHQKRIIDDVLTLSKLDSGLLAITPVEVQPSATIRQALKMFDGEFAKADIELRYGIADSYHALNIDWVRLDPSRLLQILINLITNAIKFTQTQEIRKVTVTLEAHTHRPSISGQGVCYLDKSAGKEATSPYSDDDVVYISVAVKDTGRGISPDEMKLLFQRFQQASPKTHIKYGGSGLGLFISRELARMQGGRIGVASEAGVGSTFAFFVRAHRCAAPLLATPRKDSTPGAPATVGRRRSRPSITALRESNGTDGVSKSPGTAAKKCSSELGDGKMRCQFLLVVEDNLVNQKVSNSHDLPIGLPLHSTIERKYIRLSLAPLTLLPVRR